MSLFSCLFFNLPIWMLKTVIVYYALVISLALAWRCYKILLGRKWMKLEVNSNEAVLITGATSGIGLAVAKHLYKLGYSIIIGYYDDREPGFNELKQLSQQQHQQQQQTMLFVHLDVRNQESITKAYEKISADLSQRKLKLYALVNNAGLGSLQPFAFTPRRTIKALLETNLSGPLMMVREFLPLLVQSKGRILNVSSGLGVMPGANYATYGATKSGLVYFTRCLNAELESTFGIKSVALLPQNFIKNTAIGQQCINSVQPSWEELNPLERELYEKAFQEQRQRVKEFEVASKEHAKLVAAHVKRTQQQRASRQQASSNSWDLQKFLLEAKRMITGANVALTLEESGVIECFEDALRLPSPPEQIFAGDEMYNLIVCSVMSQLPASWISLLGGPVSRSLYK